METPMIFCVIGAVKAGCKPCGFSIGNVREGSWFWRLDLLLSPTEGAYLKAGILGPKKDFMSMQCEECIGSIFSS